MALIHTYFMSNVLNMERSVDIILPAEGIPARGEKPSEAAYPAKGSVKVLYLLHGMSDDQTMWARRTSIERYVMGKNLAVIMPAAEISFYSDMKYGYDYFQYFSRELPEVMHHLFPQLSTRREDTFVAGLSMGGFGAFKLGLNCPETFSRACSLSGFLDPVMSYEEGERSFLLDIMGTLGEVKESENDLPWLLDKKLKEGVRLPRLYQCCGTDDFLYSMNKRFYERFKERTDLTYLEEPGIHNWEFWDRNIERIIEWLPLEANSEKEAK